MENRTFTWWFISFLPLGTVISGLILFGIYTVATNGPCHNGQYYKSCYSNHTWFDWL